MDMAVDGVDNRVVEVEVALASAPNVPDALLDGRWTTGCPLDCPWTT